MWSFSSLNADPGPTGEHRFWLVHPRQALPLCWLILQWMAFPPFLCWSPASQASLVCPPGREVPRPSLSQGYSNGWSCWQVTSVRLVSQVTWQTLAHPAQRDSSFFSGTSSVCAELHKLLSKEVISLVPPEEENLVLLEATSWFPRIQGRWDPSWIVFSALLGACCSVLLMYTLSRREQCTSLASSTLSPTGPDAADLGQVRTEVDLFAVLANM